MTHVPAAAWMRRLITGLLAGASACVAVAHAQSKDPFSGLHRLNEGELQQRALSAPQPIFHQLALGRLVGKADGERAIEMLAGLEAEELSQSAMVYLTAQNCEIRIRLGQMSDAEPFCAQTEKIMFEGAVSAITLATAHNALGYWMVRQGKPELALDQFENGLAVATRDVDPSLRVALLHNRGIALTLSGLMDLAIDSFESAHEEQHELPEDDPLPNILAYNLGYIQAQRGEHEAALASYEIVISWLQESEQWARVYIAKTQIALSLTALGRGQEALEELLPWVQRDDITVTPDSEAQAYLALGQAYLDIDSLDLARQHLLHGIGIARENDNPSRTRELTLAYAEMLMEQGQFELARANMIDLLVVLEASGLKAGMPEALRLLATANAAVGDYAAAYEASEKAAKAEAASQSEEFDRRLASLRVTNEIDVKDQQLALARESEAAAIALSQRDRLLQQGLIAGALALALLIYLVLSRRAKVREATMQRAAAERLEQVVLRRTQEVKDELARRHSAEQERAALELRVAKDDKLKSIGQLTGGVAHDFNNLMTVILLSAEMLLPEVKGKQEKLVRDIIGATHSGRSVTRGLLAYARQQTLKPEPINLAAYLRENHSLFQRTVGESVELSLLCRTSDDSVNILADEGQLTTCLLNLLFNGAEAMDYRGELKIELQQVENGSQLELSVTDSGRGMTEAEVAQACEPFYSTKGEARGIGLGLSMVYGFVKQSGGELDISSEPGVGTIVRLCFPTLDVTVPDRPGERETLSTHRYRVLFVEDEARIREVSRSALEMNGMEVITAENGDEARQKLSELQELDLVVSDVVMPGSLSGPQLATLVRERFPGVPVLLISGYATDVPDECAFLSKPYSKDELYEAVYSLVGDPTRVESRGEPASSG